MLFKLLGLPFLPNYIDAQAKVRIRFSQRDELTVLALAGIDNMRLNTDEKGEETEYLLSYLPRLRQETFTVRRVVPALCRAARADRHAEPLLSQ